MAVYRLHSEPVRYSYFAPIFSFATFVQLLIFGLLVTLPYIIAYATAGMWLFERCYFQQPTVLFKHQAYILTQGSSTFSNLAWSTNPNFNRIAQKNLRIPVLRSYEDDSNNDGVNDYLQLNIELPLADSESVDQITVALLFDYRLNFMSDVRMESLVYWTYTGTGSGSVLTVDGDLALTQSEPLPWRGQRLVYDKPVIHETRVDASAYDFSTILSSYYNRNETTSYEHALPFWRADRASGQPFKFQMRVRYRPQRICYRPGFWQELKFGFVQYVAILLPLLWLAKNVRWFVFGNQLVETVVRQDELSRWKAHGE